MKKIAIYGFGGFGREIEMLINQINDHKKEWEIIGYFDDDSNKKSSKIIGNIDLLNNYDEQINVVLAIGNSNIRERIYNKITNKNVIYPTLIHPSVKIKKYQNVSISEGCLICANTIITTDITINKFAVINICCTIGHDAIIGNFCSFMPSVNISGETIINDSVYMGTNSVIINDKTIGKNSIIGAGAVVVNNIPENSLAVGTPAKVIKKI